jgi:hypothetical protein
MPVMPTVVRDGIRLHFSDIGRGPVLLFHAGSMTLWNRVRASDV